MKIEVLGPFTAGRGDTRLAIGALKQRTLLGLLALQPNQTVGRDEIVDVLWGDRPPASHPNLVHTYVARIRKVLGPTAITASRAGYTLLADAAQLDVLAFQDLRDRGSRVRDPRVALDLHRAALDLWRGPVVADLPDALRRHPAAAALARLRLSAAVTCADLALEVGRPDDAVAGLLPLAAAEPLHEGVHARLMLGLAASGQQAAALRVFQDLRATLADELGIEPGAELSTAQHRVLNQDPIVRSGHHGPAQLPPAPAGFAGRENDMAVLDRLLDAPGTTVLTGMPGVGKTALALHWAHRVRDRFPDGQLHVDLREPGLSTLDALTRLLAGLGDTAVPVAVDEAAARFRSLAAGRRLLVLLDDARDAEQVRPLLPGDPGCLVLVTSRDRLDGLAVREGARRHLVRPMNTAEARDLVPGAPDRAVELCAGLPLALRIAAARLAGDASGFLAELEADRLGALAVTGDGETSVRAAFRHSYVALAPQEARVFRLLARAPATFSADTLAGLAGSPVTASLDRLAAVHLVHRLAPGHYGVHPLLRRYAAEVLAAERSAVDVRRPRRGTGRGKLLPRPAGRPHICSTSPRRSHSA
jgi:DNA-binding SARP family transcriptional activator